MTHVPDPDITDEKITPEGVPTDETLPEGHPSDPNATDPSQRKDEES
jgi:hypothetical protein